MAGRLSEDIFFYGSFGASLLFIMGGWFWAWSALHDLQGPLILHFSEYTGINQIGGLGEVHGLAATGAVIVLVNFFLAGSLRAGGRRLAMLLAGTSLFAAALLFTALAAIISVNQ